MTKSELRKSYFQSKDFKKNLNPIVIITIIILLAYSVSMLFPLWMALNASFKHEMDYRSTEIFLSMTKLPDVSFWEKYPLKNYDNIFGNYISAFAKTTVRFGKKYYVGWNLDIVQGNPRTYQFYEFVINTLMYCAGSSVVPMLASLIVAYLAANYNYKFSGILYGFVIFTMTTPMVGNAATMINFLRRIMFYDNMLLHFVRAFSYPTMYFLIFYGYFKGLSGTYAEAADIDGASQFRIMVQIYFPLCFTMMGTAVLIDFVNAWNAYEVALLWLPNYPTIAFAVWQVAKREDGPKKFALLMTLAIPIVIIFIFTKDKLMGNLTLGGIKE